MKRLIAILLAVSMLLPFLISCQDQPQHPEDKTSENTTSEIKTTGETESPPETSEPVTEAPHRDPGLEAKTFGNQDYRVLACSGYSSERGDVRDVVYIENAFTSSINEAVRDRNNYIEDTYEVTIKAVWEEINLMSGVIRKSVANGLPVVEAVETSLNGQAVMIDENCLLDLNTVKYLDLSKEYWDQNCRNNMSIAHHLFFISGDLMISDKGSIWAIKFNRDMIVDNNLINPYDLIDQNQWTYDNMYLLSQQVSHIQEPTAYLSNTYGIMSESMNTYMLWLGNGTRLITKDPITDIPQFGGLTESSYDSMVRVATMHYDKNVTLFDSDIQGDTTDEQIFFEGHALFDVGSVSGIESLRAYDIDFGVLPMPKLDDSTKNYYSALSPLYSFVFGIPSNVVDPDFVGYIAEALCCESTDTLLEAYYDRTLVYKGLRREEDERMLTLIFKNRIYDLSFVFNWADSLVNEIYGANSEKKIKRIQSLYDSYSNAIRRSIDAFLTKQGLA